jgi:hypothetical protein
MTPTTAAQCIGSYVYNSFSGISSLTRKGDAEFDEKLGHQLATFVKVFGNSQTNPLAFKGRSLRAIAFAAVWIFRRNPAVKDGDVERWKQRMPQFEFAKYPHLLGKEQEMALMMVEHWNKRLPEERKVKPYQHMGTSA